MPKAAPAAVRVHFDTRLLHGGLGRPQGAAAPAGSFVLPAAAPRRADPAALQTLSGRAMGTGWSVRLANPGFVPLAPLRAVIEAELDRVVREMSPWEAESDLSRFNRAPAGSWHALPHGFLTVLQSALAWAQASGGAWDPTVGPLVDLWGFGPRPDPLAPHDGASMPDRAALAAALARVGYARIVLDTTQGRAQQPGGAHLDLCGIAKGYAVDVVAELLAAQGFADSLVEVGGELRASGLRPDGQPWRVAVASLPDTEPARTLVLRDLSVATSGDHWHAFDHGGRRYSHTIDPRSGEPVRHALASVTVLHAQCMQADALATVLTVLGPEAGHAFAVAHGVAALFCERTDAGPAFRATPRFPALA